MPPITKKDMLQSFQRLTMEVGQMRLALSERDTIIRKLTESHNELVQLHNSLHQAVNNLPNNSRFVDALLGRMAMAFQQGQQTMTEVDANLMLEHTVVVEHPSVLNWARQVSYTEELQPVEGGEPIKKRTLHIYKGEAQEDESILWKEEEEVDAIRYRVYEKVIDRDGILPGTNVIIQVMLPNGGEAVTTDPSLPVAADINAVNDELTTAVEAQNQEIASVAPEANFNTIISDTPFDEPALKANQIKLRYSMAPDRGPEAMNIVAEVEMDGAWVIANIDQQLALHFGDAMRKAGVPEGSPRFVTHG